MSGRERSDGRSDGSTSLTLDTISDFIFLRCPHVLFESRSVVHDVNFCL